MPHTCCGFGSLKTDSNLQRFTRNVSRRASNRCKANHKNGLGRRSTMRTFVLGGCYSTPKQQHIASLNNNYNPAHVPSEVWRAAEGTSAHVSLRLVETASRNPSPGIKGERNTPSHATDKKARSYQIAHACAFLLLLLAKLHVLLPAHFPQSMCPSVT